jgi:hypothetical protein
MVKLVVVYNPSEGWNTILSSTFFIHKKLMTKRWLTLHHENL